MTQWKQNAALVLASGLALSLVAVPAAFAKIRCSADGFQYVQGSWLSTPYCQDNLVAKVARQYGVKVSDAEIRYNPNRKAEVCRFVGHDIRIRNACQGLEGDRRRF
ncbi:MAG: hypothetical protein ACKVP4_03295 [Hyphomicrobium sp.]